ncbi:MAG: efflux RND transporter permease subunit [Beijerinckiaceae bacterium]
MSISELCIRRPVMTTLLMMSFIVFGIFGYMKLPVAALPRVDFPTISVTARLSGASPETMAASVAAPLERAFATIPGITQMTSTSQPGRTTITMQFDLDRSIDGAALDVQTQIAGTMRRLPPEVTEAPSFRKVNPADSPILFLSITSPTLGLSTINDYAEQVLAQQISQIQGVAQVLIYGQRKFAVRIEVDPDKAASRGLTLNEIRTAVAQANSSSPVGDLRGSKRKLSLQASGQITKAEGYQNLVVAWRGGSPVRLREVARVYDSVENNESQSWYKKESSITLAIFRQSDANTVEVVDSVKERLPRFRAQLPASINTYVLLDRSISIRESIEDVQVTLAIAIFLVILVIFLFLKSLAATIIPSLALPVSLIGTCAFMYLFGYSIDNISLLAITLSVGFVVDDAIVMLENIVRHIEEGEKPFEAALRGSKEIGFTILSITLSLVAVFIPVLLMGGIVGRVFREFAVVISCAILVSGFVSLTLTPMLCARMLKPIDHHKRPGAFSRSVDMLIDGMTAAYRISLDAILKVRLLMLLATIATLFISVQMFKAMPKGFFPVEDTGFLIGSSRVAPDTSFEVQAAATRKLVDILLKDPAVEYVNSVAGVGGGSNRGSIFIALKPKAERGPIGPIIGRLRGKASSVPGISAIFRPIQNLNLQGGRPSRAEYQYTLQSGDIGSLYDKAPVMEERLRALPGLRDVDMDLEIANPQLKLEIDREKAAAFNVSAETIRQTLYNHYGSRQISTIYTQAADYAVIMEAANKFQDDPSVLNRVYVRAQGANGQLVPLGQVVKISREVGPLTINRQAQQPSVTISFNLAPGVAIGQAVESIQRVEREVGLPATITTNFSGSAKLFQDSLKGQVPLILAAILTIYIVLGVLYESFIHPITILSGLPSAGIGALIALNYFDMDLSVIAIIGILMLIGIVKKNAIMMIDFAIERRREGMDAALAIREAALIRFRPIMMTTLAAIFGAVPIALGHGAGAELRQPLGIAVVGGLLFSQLLTLYITPVVYIYLDKIDSYVSGRHAEEREVRAAQQPFGVPEPVRQPAE